MFAIVPYRAFNDKRLSRNDLKVLIAACGFLNRSRGEFGQAQVPQQWIADQLGVYHTLIYRHVKRLESFGYLLKLASKNKAAGMATLYGIVFDENDEHSTAMPAIMSDLQPSSYPIKAPAGKPSTVNLIAAWRKLVNDYVPNELENGYWHELSVLGATPADVTSWYIPGRNSIGYYMQTARRHFAGGLE